MNGRPINQDRQIAISLGFQTYNGTAHSKCGTTERYTKGAGCVHCARLIATEQREARAYLREARAYLRAQKNSAPEPAEELDNPDEGMQDKADARFQDDLEDLM